MKDIRGIEIIDFGTGEYKEILDLQTSLFEKIKDSKKSGELAKEYFLIGEHPHVITLGRKANSSNILISEEILKERGVKIFHIGRGGDVTYHCEGQLVIYPIIDLSKHKLGVKDYVALLEETVIRLIGKYGLKGERIPGKTGVWLGKDTERERKISAIGIKCSRFCTMHGLSLNINCDLKGFENINPCGFSSKGVTSMQNELNHSIDIEKIKKEISDIFFSLIFSFEKVLDFPE